MGFAKRWAGVDTVPVTKADAIRHLPLHSYMQLDQIGFFCHGWPNGLSIWKPTGSAYTNAHELAGLIANIIKPDGNIGLFACRTAEDQKVGLVSAPGFAARLSERMSFNGLPGITVMAHDFPAHTVRNPHDVLFLDGKRIYSYPDPRNYKLEGGLSLVEAGQVRPRLRATDKAQIEWMDDMDYRPPKSSPLPPVPVVLAEWNSAYEEWCKWERSDKGGQRGLSLMTIDGWKAAELATGLKLALGGAK